MKKRFLLLVAASLCLTSVFAQSKLSNASVLLLQQQNEKTKGISRIAPTDATIKMSNGRQVVSCYVHFKDAIDESVLEMYDAQLRVRFDEAKIATADVPVDALEALSENDKVFYVEVAQPLEFKLNTARTISKVDRINAVEEPLTRAYHGKGVLMGVVDQELQYGHPAFWNEDHNRFRIKRVWNQGISGTAPVGGFMYGHEYTDSANILTAKYDIVKSAAESGHATHVMGIAAGADHTLNYYGIAQEADIAYVACPGTYSNGIPEGIRYIFKQADDLNYPACVVNVSMGGWQGPHDGTSTECTLIDGMIGPGRVVCMSAGNEGTDKIHWDKTFSATDTLGKTLFSLQDVGADYKMAYCDMWGDTGKTYDVRFIVFDKNAKETIYESSWFSSQSSSPSPITVKRTVKTTNDLYFQINLAIEVNPVNHRGNVLVKTTVFSLPDRTAFGFEVKANDGRVNVFTSEQLCTFSVLKAQESYGFTDGNTNMTLSEPSGVAKKVISVGAYTSHPKVYGTQGAKADFSSMGPTLDGRIKPDISAPGQTLLSAYPDFDKIKSGRSVSTEVGGQTYYYGYMQGTSMSSPYAAGVIALWLEADPTLDYDGIIDVFRHSSTVDSFTGAVPNNSWGLGKIDAYHGLLYVLGLSTNVQNPEIPSVLAVYEEGNSDVFKIGFSKEMNDLTVRVVDMSGRIVYTKEEGSVMAGQEISVDLSSMTPGMYIINVGGENYKVVR